MVTLKCEYEEENRVNKVGEIGSEQGLRLSLNDEKGEILHIECSCHPKTTVVRTRIRGNMGIIMTSDGGWKHSDELVGTIVIKRV